MIPKTLTTIGRLQDGDRFYFTGNKKEVQQLECFANGSAFYNRVIGSEPATGHAYRKSTSKNREVIFLRHTIKTIENETSDNTTADMQLRNA